MPDYKIQGESLLVDIQDGIATLTLNRPNQRNALSRQLRENITQAIIAANADENVSVIIMTGAGDKAFSAGLDLKQLDETPLTIHDMGVDSTLMQAYAALEKPLIAAVNGVAVAGGLELALLADIAIASESARFADTHARVGILPAWGATQTLPMAIGPVRARYMCLTGNYIDAVTARDWGLVFDVVPALALMPRARELASAMLECDSTALSDIRQCINHGVQQGHTAGLALETKLAKQSVQRFEQTKFAATRKQVIKRGQEKYS